MVPKSSGGAIAPKGAPRLPPLPKLKIKRPNKVEVNPCIGVLSSVLGAHPSITVTKSKADANIFRLLGIVGIHGTGLRTAGAAVASMHGRKSMFSW